MLRMIVIAFFQQLAVLSSALMQLHGLLFLFLLFRKRNIDLLATHFARKRNLFVKVQGIEIAQFRYISAGETGCETSTPNRGSGEYGANNENKHTTANTARKAMCG